VRRLKKYGRRLTVLFPGSSRTSRVAGRSLPLSGDPANVAKQADQLKGQLGRDKTLPKRSSRPSSAAWTISRNNPASSSRDRRKGSPRPPRPARCSKQPHACRPRSAAGPCRAPRGERCAATSSRCSSVRAGHEGSRRRALSDGGCVPRHHRGRRSNSPAMRSSTRSVALRPGLPRSSGAVVRSSG